VIEKKPGSGNGEDMVTFKAANANHYVLRAGMRDLCFDINGIARVCTMWRTQWCLLENVWATAGTGTYVSELIKLTNKSSFNRFNRIRLGVSLNCSGIVIDGDYSSDTATGASTQNVFDQIFIVYGQSGGGGTTAAIKFTGNSDNNIFYHVLTSNGERLPAVSGSYGLLFVNATTGSLQSRHNVFHYFVGHIKAGSATYGNTIRYTVGEHTSVELDSGAHLDFEVSDHGASGTTWGTPRFDLVDEIDLGFPVVITAGAQGSVFSGGNAEWVCINMQAGSTSKVGFNSIAPPRWSRGGTVVTGDFLGGIVKLKLYYSSSVVVFSTAVSCVTNSSTTVTMASPAVTTNLLGSGTPAQPLAAGMLVTGSNIPTGTYIASLAPGGDTSKVVLTQAATSSITTNLTFSNNRVDLKVQGACRDTDPPSWLAGQTSQTYTHFELPTGNKTSQYQVDVPFAPQRAGTDGVSVAGDATFTSAAANFTVDDVGRSITINGAGGSGGNLTTTIDTFNSESSVELGATASTSVNPATWTIASSILPYTRTFPLSFTVERLGANATDTFDGTLHLMSVGMVFQADGPQAYAPAPTATRWEVPDKYRL